MIKYTFEKKFYIVSEVKASPSKFFQEYTIFMRTRFLNGADFGSMLRNLQLSIFSAATQLGIFTVLLVAILMGFTSREAASLGDYRWCQWSYSHFYNYKAGSSFAGSDYHCRLFLYGFGSGDCSAGGENMVYKERV